MVNGYRRNTQEFVATDSFFKDFVVRKSDNSIILKSNEGFKRVQFDYYNTYDLSRDSLALEIKPGYDVHYNVLHKWFEKYSKLPLKVQRSDWSVGLVGNMFNRTSEFYFLESRKDYTEDLYRLRTEVVSNASYVFSTFATIEGYYNYYIGDVIGGKRELPDGGIDWVVRYLIATKLVAPSNYGLVKSLIMDRVEFLKGRNEPNIMMYYNELPMIIDDLESTDFSSFK